MNKLSSAQLERASFLLWEIVRPGDHDFWDEIEEAQKLLGCWSPPPPSRKRGRPFKKKPRAHSKARVVDGDANL